MPIVFHGQNDPNIVPLLDILASLATCIYRIVVGGVGASDLSASNVTAHTLLRLPGGLMYVFKFDLSYFQRHASSIPTETILLMAGAMLICE